MSNYFDTTPQGIAAYRNSKCSSAGQPAQMKCSVCKEFRTLTAGHKRKPRFVCSRCVKEGKCEPTNQQQN